MAAEKWECIYLLLVVSHRAQLTIRWWDGPVVRGGEGNGWLVSSDGANACRVVRSRLNRIDSSCLADMRVSIFLSHRSEELEH